jgi:outer membrane protein assembly factor BamB
MKTSKIISTVAIVILLLIMSVAAFLGGFGQGLSNSSNTTNAPPTSGYGNLAQYEWPQFTGDSAFSHYSTGPAPEAADILWKTNITGIQPYISAFNNKIYVCTKTSVFALDQSMGTILWNTTVPSPGPWPAVYKIDGTHMVVGSSCLDPETGQVLWTSPDFSATSAPLFTYNVYSPEEKMFYTKVNSYVQAWDFSNPAYLPKIIWSTYVSGSGLDGSGIQYGDGKVFPGSFESHQMALDAKTGTVIWNTNTKAAMIFSGTYYDGKFFRGGAHDNTFYAFDAKTGKIVWTYSPKTEDGYFCTGVAAAYGMVYGLNRDGNLYAFDANTGTLIWNYTGPGPLMFPGNPTIADGKVYATTGQAQNYGGINSTSEFACLDAYTGQVIWKLPIEAFAPRESVAIAYGNLFMIPGDVTKAVDTISGAEYSTVNQVLALGTTAWPMFRHDATHTAAGQSGPTNLTLRWSFNTGGAVVSSPSIANGIAYFGSQDKNIYAVNARDGSFIWKFTTLERIESSPAVIDGRVYSGTDDGNIYCLNAYNGSLIWKTSAGGITVGNFNAAVQLRSSPTVLDGYLYVGALDNQTYCLNAKDGSLVWKYQTQGFITSSPAVDNGAVYIVSQEPASGALYKLDAYSGSLDWKLSLPYQTKLGGGTDMHASPTVADGMVFASSEASAYYGINATSGNIVWTYKDNEAGEFIVCSPIYVDGKLFIVDKFSIVSVDAKTGKTNWTSFTGDELYVSPSYAYGKLYVVTDERSIWVLNTTDGKKLGYFGVSSNSWSAPSIYEGRVYVGSNNWNVYCLADYPALSSSITIGLTKSEVYSDELVTGWGQLTPAMPNAAVTVILVRPDGTPTSMNVETSATGNFAFTFTPTNIGNWTLAAEWTSDKSFYRSAVSEMITLLVNNAPTPTPTETPTASPTPTSTPSPVPTPTPFDQMTFWGMPMMYVYVLVIAVLVAVITVAGYVYMKTAKR